MLELSNDVPVAQYKPHEQPELREAKLTKLNQMTEKIIWEEEENYKGETAPPQRRHRQLPPTPQHHHNHEPNHKTRHTPATRAKPASEQNGKSITPKTSKVRTLCFRDTKEEKTIPLQPATHLPPTKQYDTETGAEDEKNHHLHALLSLQEAKGASCQTLRADFTERDRTQPGSSLNHLVETHRPGASHVRRQSQRVSRAENRTRREEWRRPQ